MKTSFRKLIISISLVVISGLSGIAGFMIIENFSFIEALYMTVITLSTVGFKEVHALSTPGMVFISIYITFNLGIFAYIITYIAKYVFEGDLKKEFRLYISYREMKKMKNHVVICGYGRNGYRASQELKNKGLPFIIIDQNKSAVAEINPHSSLPMIVGDATNENILEEVNTSTASYLITTLPDDAHNVYITLSAKEMNPNIHIIARASNQIAVNKLKKAGADNVVMPDILGGKHMAELIIKPNVVKLLDLLEGEEGLNMDEFHCQNIKVEYQNMSIAEMKIRQHTGASVLAYINSKDEFSINPSPNTIIEEDGNCIMVGNKEALKKFEKHYIK